MTGLPGKQPRQPVAFALHQTIQRRDNRQQTPNLRLAALPRLLGNRQQAAGGASAVRLFLARLAGDALFLVDDNNKAGHPLTLLTGQEVVVDGAYMSGADGCVPGFTSLMLTLDCLSRRAPIL